MPLPLEVYLTSGAPGVPGVPGQPKSLEVTLLNSLVHTLICSGACRDEPCPVTFAPLVHAAGTPLALAALGASNAATDAAEMTHAENTRRAD